MLLRRRARLTSASCLHRRACAETTTTAVRAPARLVQSLASPPPSLKPAPPLNCAMHSTTPQPKSTLSPAPSCRWRRGRPVTAHRASSMSTNAPAMVPATDQAPPQCSADVQGRHVDDEAADGTSLADALHNIRLAGAVHGVHFTATPRRAAPHAVDTVTSPSRLPGLHGSRTDDLGASAINERDEHAITTALSDMESKDDADMDTSSGSDYTPSQAEENDSNEQDKETQEEEEQEKDGGEEPVEEHIDLDYQIPEDVLRAAMQASPNTRASFWSANLYRGPEDQSLAIHYCKTMDVAERVLQHFVDEKVLGFDIEWRPYSHVNSIKGNASLVQLACEDRIALFHIALFPGSTIEKLVPPTLKTILESPEIYKVGVAVKGDFSRLQRYLGIQPQGVFELSRLHNLVEAADPDKATHQLVSLARQVHQHLQLPLYKGGSLADEPDVKSSVRESDWSEPLDLQQIHYAAGDAYAGFRLYHMLEWKRKQLRPTRPTRGLCDYDSKPRPKAPGAKKAVRKRKQASKAVTEETVPAPEEELEDDEDGEEGYETAPEEILGSPELEAPTEDSTEPASGSGHGETPSQRRVGRVNLSWLRGPGPDPGYPSLPVEPDEEHNQPDGYSVSHDSNGYGDRGQIVSPAVPVRKQVFEAGKEEDEFADPELEEALQIMDIDDQGKLIELPPCPTHAPGRGAAPVAAHAELLKNETQMPDYKPLLSEADGLITTPPTSATLTSTSTEPLRSTEYTQATSWANEYLRSTIPSPTSTTPSRIRATVPHLRAYHMWHTQRLSVDDIAAHLRDPPLSRSTVTGYILQAVQSEQLEVDVDATREMMRSMPRALVMGRFRRMAQRVGALG